MSLIQMIGLSFMYSSVVKRSKTLYPNTRVKPHKSKAQLLYLVPTTQAISPMSVR